MKNWVCTNNGRYGLWVENKEYGEIAVLYDNEIYYEKNYKKGKPKFSYSMMISGQSKHGEIDVTNLNEAQEQLEKIVLNVYEKMIDMMNKTILDYKNILESLS